MRAHTHRYMRTHASFDLLICAAKVQNFMNMNVQPGQGVICKCPGIYWLRTAADSILESSHSEKTVLPWP